MFGVARNRRTEGGNEVKPYWTPSLRVIEELPESLAHLEEVHRRAKGLAREKFVLDEPTAKKRKRE